VNNKRITEMGFHVDPEVDQVTVSGRPVTLVTESALERVHILLHKPPQVMTTVRDDRGRKTVLDLISKYTRARLYPVGRLDFDSEGALLLTNDGPLAHKLTHPRFNVPKTYLVKVKGVPTDEKLEKIRRGMYLDDGPTKPAAVSIASRTKVNTWCEITITEGKNRLIKRMFWRIKHPVMRLVRTDFAGVSIEDVAPGQYRLLTNKELTHLKSWVR